MRTHNFEERRGRPVTLPVEVTRRIVELRQGGMILKDIAATLNAEGLPTATGKGQWTISRVQTALDARTAARILTGV